MNLILLGPPGSGKGTQAKLLCKKKNLIHISTGQLLRQEVKKSGPKATAIKTYMENGQLVPFDTILELFQSTITSTSQGFILEGAPRNLSQAEHLDWFFQKNNIKLNKIIFLKISDQEVTSRLLKRAQKENRSDDNLETIKKRLKVYHQQTEPVIDYYRQKDLLLEINGSPDIDTIHQEILQNLLL